MTHTDLLLNVSDFYYIHDKADRDIYAAPFLWLIVSS